MTTFKSRNAVLIAIPAPTRSTIGAHRGPGEPPDIRQPRSPGRLDRDRSGAANAFARVKPSEEDLIGPPHVALASS